MKLVLAFIFSVLTFSCKAQNVMEDFLSISNQINQPKAIVKSYYTGDKNNQNMMKYTNKKSSYNPLFILGKIAMYGYQNIISPQLFINCPYEITCSNYCKIAVENNGIISGVFMGAERLLRCNKMSMLDVNTDLINPISNKISDTQ